MIAPEAIVRASLMLCLLATAAALTACDDDTSSAESPDSAAPDMGAALDARVVTAPDGAVDGAAPSTGWLKIAAGGDHACAIAAEPERAVWCWGDNEVGQLGDGTANSSTVPVRVLDLSGAIDISAGWITSCAALADGSLWCWGSNDLGQLGDGVGETSAVPVRALGLAGVTAVGCGDGHTCAVHDGGAVSCWGLNDSGQLGNGAELDSPVPARVVGLNGAVTVAAGFDTSCASDIDGRAWCWGDNFTAQLGGGTQEDSSSTPVEVLGVEDVAAVVAGDAHGCVLTNDGTVRCWGESALGQLGDGTSGEDRTDPTGPDLRGATALAASIDHTCAIDGDGVAWCWGANRDDQENMLVGKLGGGEQVDGSPTPVRVVGLPGAMRQIAAGDQFTCALTVEGAPYCWGFNGSGQLGDGGMATAWEATPVQR